MNDAHHKLIIQRNIWRMLYIERLPYGHRESAVEKYIIMMPSKQSYNINDYIYYILYQDWIDDAESNVSAQ